jgi:hypothetical protein
MDLNEEQQGYLFDICVSLWEQVEKKPSVRFTAFRFINKTAYLHPELYNELQLLTEEKYMSSLSPAVHKSILKMLKNTSVHLKSKGT